MRVLGLLLLANFAWTQEIPPVALGKDYPGVIQLHVDASDVSRRVLKVRETIKVTPGPLVLFYPQWLQGKHHPYNDASAVAGLDIRANGKKLSWHRDPYQVAAFHVLVPKGSNAIEINFESLTPTDPSQGRVVMTQQMINLQWGDALLYPAGFEASRIKVEASLTPPSNWRVFGALKSKGSHVMTFEATDLDTLMDSPLYIGKYAKQFALAAAPDVHLDIVADRPEQIPTSSEFLTSMKQLVTEAQLLFSSHHYDHYDFLLALTDELGAIGLEHHRSNEATMGAGLLRDYKSNMQEAGVLPHEYCHSWNGKFRRPEGLTVPNFNTPLNDSLLWVYEGFTQYCGEVLGTRSGLFSMPEQLDAFAAFYAGRYNYLSPGTHWRPIEDTTYDPILQNRHPLPYQSYQLSEDYYRAGALMWFAADATIRQKTQGKKSLDDFARVFYGMDNTSWKVKPYRFEDVVAALNQVVAMDWATFLSERMMRPRNPASDLALSGYKLVLNDKKNASITAFENAAKFDSFDFSLGFAVDRQGNIGRVVWDGPAFRAGVASSMKLHAVNGLSYSRSVLEDAIKASQKSRQALVLLLQQGQTFLTVKVPYYGGLLYPHLERIKGQTDWLTPNFAPLAAKSAKEAH